MSGLRGSREPADHPVVRLDVQQIQQAGRKLSPIAEELISFPQAYIVNWAERIGAIQ
jgi:hypothetical protein